MQNPDPILAAVVDLRQYLYRLIARRNWYLPDGALITCDPPMTAAEVAEAYGLDNPEDVEVAA